MGGGFCRADDEGFVNQTMRDSTRDASLRIPPRPAMRATMRVGQTRWTGVGASTDQSVIRLAQTRRMLMLREPPNPLPGRCATHAPPSEEGK